MCPAACIAVKSSMPFLNSFLFSHAACNQTVGRSCIVSRQAMTQHLAVRAGSSLRA